MAGSNTGYSTGTPRTPPTPRVVEFRTKVEKRFNEIENKLNDVVKVLAELNKNLNNKMLRGDTEQVTARNGNANAEDAEEGISTDLNDGEDLNAGIEQLWSADVGQDNGSDELWPNDIGQSPNLNHNSVEFKDHVDLKWVNKIKPSFRLKSSLGNYQHWERHLFNQFKLLGWTNLNLRHALRGEVKPSFLTNRWLVQFLESSCYDSDEKSSQNLLNLISRYTASEVENSGFLALHCIRRAWKSQYSNRAEVFVTKLSEIKFTGGYISIFCNKYLSLYTECEALKAISWGSWELFRIKSALQSHPNSQRFLPFVKLAWEKHKPSSPQRALDLATEAFISVFPDGKADQEVTQNVADSKKDRGSSNRQQRDHKNCAACGLKHKENNCYAKGKECHFCHKKGHFAQMCRKKKETNNKDRTNNVIEESQVEIQNPLEEFVAINIEHSQFVADSKMWTIDSGATTGGTPYLEDLVNPREVVKVDTKENEADILTKALSPATFIAHRDKFMTSKSKLKIIDTQ